MNKNGAGSSDLFPERANLNRSNNANGANDARRRAIADSAAAEFIHYAELLARRWRLIMGASFAIGFAVALVVRFCVPKYYRAQSTITPEPPKKWLGEMTGVSSGATASSELLQMLTRPDQTDNSLVSQRFVATMRSYTFTTDLQDRYRVVSPVTDSNETRTAWQIYQKISGNFDCEYDFITGNLTLYYFDYQPDRARRILEFYVEALRDQLRSEELEEAKVAYVSLQEALARTSDSLLRTELSEFVAQQVERGSLAQAESNFAFVVVDSPYVPDAPAGPSARRFGMLASLLTFLCLCGWVTAADVFGRARGLATGDNLSYSAPADTHNNQAQAADG
jgi:hypothetical protein